MDWSATKVSRCPQETFLNCSIFQTIQTVFGSCFSSTYLFACCMLVGSLLEKLKCWQAVYFFSTDWWAKWYVGGFLRIRVLLCKSSDSSFFRRTLILPISSCEEVCLQEALAQTVGFYNYILQRLIIGNINLLELIQWMKQTSVIASFSLNDYWIEQIFRYHIWGNFSVGEIA